MEIYWLSRKIKIESKNLLLFFFSWNRYLFKILWQAPQAIESCYNEGKDVSNQSSATKTYAHVFYMRKKSIFYDFINNTEQKRILFYIK